MQRIVIIGGGFSGTLVSVHLLRSAHAHRSLHITIVEREPRRIARGFAYSTPHQACVLNVPAGRMSAFEDDAAHFVRWASTRDPSITGATFVPRSMYGDYLIALLNDAQAAAGRSAHLDRIAVEVVGIDDPAPPAPAKVTLADGRTLDADRIVLATGNFPPCDPPTADAKFAAGDRYTQNPWAPDALSGLPTDTPSLLIGTGLTMLDVAIVLRDGGNQSKMHAVSRRGLVPQPHRVAVKPPPTLPFPESMRLPNPTLLRLFKALRREVQEQSGHGLDWREVVTALRQDTPRLWGSLDPRGKRQFLRHLMPFWETHRHRAAPETARRIQRLSAEGALLIQAARILRIEEDAEGVRVSLRRRGTGSDELLRVGHVINCTGPDTDIERCGGTLLQTAISEGLLQPDELRLGLEVAADGATIRADGTVSRRIFTIGPLRRSRLWETTAVPELRAQAAALAASLL